MKVKMPKCLIKLGLKAKEASPEILLGVGIVAIVGGGVLACVNTAKKLGDICDEREDAIKEFDEENGLADKSDMELVNDVPSELQAERTEVIKAANHHMAFEIAKLYSIPVGLVILGTTSILVGHHQIRKRYLVMSAAYSAMSKAYDTYRRRIAEKFGEEADYYGRYGYERQKIKVVNEDGSVTEEEANVVDPDQLYSVASPYARVIGRDSFLFRECGGSPIHIRSQLECYQEMLNTQYFNGQPIYYNDVIKWIFGNDPTKMSDDGQIVGWYRRDPKNNEYADDKGIDLRISTFYGKRGDDDPYDRDYLYIQIDPNVAGPISLERGQEYVEKITARYQESLTRTSGKYSSIITRKND